MRFIKRLLSIIFTIAFIASISINIILGLSSTNTLIFKDSYDAREQLYYTSVSNLGYSNEITIINESIYSENTDQKIRETISCVKEEGAMAASCSMVSRLYNNDYSTDNLVRTSYFPGDGFKYSLEGSTQTKTAYSNTELESYYASMIAGASIYTHYILLDEDEGEKEFVSIDTKASFDFNTFSLKKTVKVKYTKENDSWNVTVSFDGCDRLSEIIVDENTKLSFSYKKTTLQFPSFEGYLA